MQRLVKSFSGDYQVMRVCFANSDPLQTYVDLHDKISIKQFYDFVEMLDAKQTMEEDAQAKAKRKSEADAQEQQRKANKGF